MAGLDFNTAVLEVTSRVDTRLMLSTKHLSWDDHLHYRLDKWIHKTLLHGEQEMSLKKTHVKH